MKLSPYFHRLIVFSIASSLLGCGSLEKFKQPVANFAKSVEALNTEVRSEISHANLANQDYRYARLTTREEFVVDASEAEKKQLPIKSDASSLESLKSKYPAISVKADLSIGSALGSLAKFADILTQLADNPAEDKVFSAEIGHISTLFASSGAALAAVGSEVTDEALRTSLETAGTKIKTLSAVAQKVASLLLEGERVKAITHGLNKGLPEVEEMLVSFNSILSRLQVLEKEKLVAHRQMLTELMTKESLLGTWSFSDEYLMRAEIKRLNLRLEEVEELTTLHKKLIGNVVSAIVALRAAAGMDSISNEQLKPFLKEG